MTIDPDMWLISKTSEIVNVPEGLPLNSLKIYPNPTTGYFHISVTNSELIQEVKLYDTTGKCVSTFPANSNEIDLSDQAPGIYIVQVKTNSGEFTQKISKK